MNAENLPLYFVFGVFAVLLGALVSRYVKYGSFKGAIFGARIKDTMGEVIETGGRIVSTTMRVHVLEDGAPGKDVGLEFVTKGLGSYRMSVLSLSVSETRKLIQYLQSAVAGRKGWT